MKRRKNDKPRERRPASHRRTVRKERKAKTALLDQKIAQPSSKIRETEISQSHTDTPDDQLRSAYVQKANRAARNLQEIIETSATCGKEFQQYLREAVLERFTGHPTHGRGDRPTEGENLREILILHQTSKSSANPNRLKELVPEGRDVERGAKVLATQLNRFCDRVYKVWYELGCPPPASWTESPCSETFWSKCSLKFPKDTGITLEAIKRALKHKHARNMKQAQERARNKSAVSS